MLPVPSAMVRRPVRLICTGMAWLGSVISMAVAVKRADMDQLSHHALAVEQWLAFEQVVEACLC